MAPSLLWFDALVRSYRCFGSILPLETEPGRSQAAAPKMVLSAHRWRIAATTVDDEEDVASTREGQPPD